jgi:hypothetical protein
MTDVTTFLKKYKDTSFNVIISNNDLRDYFINIAPLLYNINIDKSSDNIVTDDLNTKGFYINYEKGIVEENKEMIDKELLLYPLKIFQLLTK